MNRRLRNKSGFTLLEIIIVIIIIAILASLAMPRFLRTSQYSYSAEALANLSALRQAMNRCYLFSSSYAPCDTFDDLDTGDPGLEPNAHFTYGIGGLAAGTFNITATGSVAVPTDIIWIDQTGAKGGNGIFSGIR
ncbi:MAG: type IV pilin protein [Candidatus Omnitrophota bacterium]